MTHQICISCSKEYEIAETVYSCRKCGGLIEIRIDLERAKEEIAKGEWRKVPLSVWRYRPLIPVRDSEKIVTLEEGGTNLLHVDKLAGDLGIRQLYVKNEGENPTGSFKDRGMTVGVTRALEVGARRVICASTGNTSASLAAYAARAGILCEVFVPSGKVASGKMIQTMIYGARIVRVKGNFDRALEGVLKKASESSDAYLLNSVNPFRIEGQKSAAFEIIEQLDGDAPDAVVVPVGNAGNISAIWKGFLEAHEVGLCGSLPRMIGVQAAGASPIADAVQRARKEIAAFKNPETVASAIRIGAPVSWRKALRAIYDSRGTAVKVSDREIVAAQRKLARSEGLFIEPASAASVAGLRKLLGRGDIDRDEKVVCVATGHGLKDPDIVLRRAKPVKTVSLL